MSFVFIQCDFHYYSHYYGTRCVLKSCYSLGRRVRRWTAAPPNATTPANNICAHI